MLAENKTPQNRPKEPPQADLAPAVQEGVPTAPCPICGFPMLAIRGSKDAICRNCGFKDSCCY